MSKYVYHIVIITIFLFLLPSIVAAISHSGPTVRVALAKKERNITNLSGGQIYCFLPTAVEEEARSQLNETISIESSDGGFKVNGNLLSPPLLICKSINDQILVNRRPYAGSLFFYRNDDNSYKIINVIPIEDYLVNVLHHEVSPSWPKTTLEAQAIAARTYTLAKRRHRIDNPYYDVESTVLDQVYKSVSSKKGSIQNAVDNTVGKVLTRKGKIIKAFYSSTCGGETEKPSHVWPNALDLPTQKDPYCKRAPHHHWEHNVNADNLRARINSVLNMSVQKIKSIDIEKFVDSRRIETVRINTDEGNIGITGNEFRRVAGFQKVKSTWFDMKRTKNGWSFKGRGYGHGVGLCQWGAREMGNRGIPTEGILDFYYPSTKIVRVY